MGIDRPRISEVIVIPHIIKNLLSRKGNSLVLYKIRQKLKFLIAQINVLTVDRNLMRRLINADSSDLD